MRGLDALPGQVSPPASGSRAVAAPALTVLDLFSAAAGGWSLGMHRAGFHTVAACEREEWRRALYAENNPGVILYDDVCTLTADRIRHDLGSFPWLVVGSPPCQDISSANTKGKGVDGARSGLFFEAVRIIGEGRPRWFALENSANLRTRGADRVIAALAAIGYTCWTFVVGVDDIGGNNERKRSWLIGCNVSQLNAHPNDQGELRRALNAEVGKLQAVGNHRGGHDAANSDAADADRDAVRLPELSGRPDEEAAFAEHLARHAAQDGRGPRLPGGRAGPTPEPEQPACRDALDAAGERHEGGRSRGRGPDGDGSSSTAEGHDADAAQERPEGLTGHPRLERQGEVAERADLPAGYEMGLREADRRLALQHRPDWSLDDLARHIRLDDGLPAWVAQQRIAVGGPRGTSAASLIVEAFGDSVCPQIPEAIGRAILRTEAALSALIDFDETEDFMPGLDPTQLVIR